MRECRASTVVHTLGAAVLLCILHSDAAAQPRDPGREHALLVGLCLAAVEEGMRVTPLERVVLLPAAERECRDAPGATLYRLKGGRVFEWRPMPERRPEP